MFIFVYIYIYTYSLVANMHSFDRHHITMTSRLVHTSICVVGGCLPAVTLVVGVLFGEEPSGQEAGMFREVCKANGSRCGFADAFVFTLTDRSSEPCSRYLPGLIGAGGERGRQESRLVEEGGSRLTSRIAAEEGSQDDALALGLEKPGPVCNGGAPDDGFVPSLFPMIAHGAVKVGWVSCICMRGDAKM